MTPQLSRRAVLAGMSAGAFASSSSVAASKPVRLGGPIFLKSNDPVELAREHRRLGYAAAYCPGVKPGDKERIKAIEKAFAAENVIIAEVGAWKNMLDPDLQKRKENLQFVLERLALADEVGARCCVDIAGSFNPKVWYGTDPRNFSDEFLQLTVENCRRLIDTVKPKRTKFAVEMMGWAIPEGPDSYLRLIKAVDRKEFGVHIDVCNGINSPVRFYGNAKFIAETFQKLGPWIVSCHAKDLDWPAEMNVHFVEVAPGRGSIDYRAYLRAVAGLAQDAPLMIEHLKTAEEYQEAASYIRKTGTEIGISFV